MRFETVQISALAMILGLGLPGCGVDPWNTGTDTGDQNDTDTNVNTDNNDVKICYRDADEDGSGDPEIEIPVAGTECISGYVDNKDDCDDSDDSVTDECGTSSNEIDCYPDDDGDGRGDREADAETVNADDGCDSDMVEDHSDYCDDDKTAYSKDACDGASVDMVECWPDEDGDGHGDRSADSKEFEEECDTDWSDDDNDYCDDNEDEYTSSGCATVEVECWPDEDDDTYGDVDADSELFEGECDSGWVENDNDHCDGDEDNHTSSDCSSNVITCYRDSDRDGYGDAAHTQDSDSTGDCPSGYTDNDNDECDDNQAAHTTSQCDDGGSTTVTRTNVVVEVVLSSTGNADLKVVNITTGVGSYTAACDTGAGSISDPLRCTVSMAPGDLIWISGALGSGWWSWNGGDLVSTVKYGSATITPGTPGTSGKRWHDNGDSTVSTTGGADIVGMNPN